MMRKILQLVLLLSIAFSCVCKKNQSTKTTENSAKVSKQIPMAKPNYSPGTFALSIKITEITKKDNRYQVKVIVNKTLGSGSGITRIFADGEKISFELTKDHEFLINKDYHFLFKEVQIMGANKPKLLFIKELN